MSLVTAPDINVIIIVPSSDQNNNSSKPLIQAERRISPSWTILQLKSKLEPITGIPVSCQILRTTKPLSSSLFSTTTSPTSDLITLQDSTYVHDPSYGLHKGSEIHVHDTRPPGARQNFTDVSTVEKYEMPVEEYERLDDSVLAWKRKQRLGRFDPNAKSAGEMMEERKTADEGIVKRKKIETGKRCRVGKDDTRRGEVRFVGEIRGLGGEREAGCIWVGVELDEPLGRNDGSVKIESESGGGAVETKKIFECRDKFGVFVRPEKIDVGDYPPLDDLDEDMEEL